MSGAFQWSNTWQCYLSKWLDGCNYLGTYSGSVSVSWVVKSLNFLLIGFYLSDTVFLISCSFSFPDVFWSLLFLILYSDACLVHFFAAFWTVDFSVHNLYLTVISIVSFFGCFYNLRFVIVWAKKICNMYVCSFYRAFPVYISVSLLIFQRNRCIYSYSVPFFDFYSILRTVYALIISFLFQFFC